MTQKWLTERELVQRVIIRLVPWQKNWAWGFTPSTIGKAVLSRRCTAGEFARDKGIIQAFQEVAGGPWWYQVTPEDLETLRSKIHRVPVKSE